MTLLVLALLVALLGAGWVIHPLVARRWSLLSDTVSPRVVARETKRRVALVALKEVEYDRVAGKLDEADYTALRSQLEVEALAALRDVDPAPPPTRSARKHSCGFVNPPASRFCAGCGAPLP